MEAFEAVSLVIISLGAFILPLVGQRIKIPGIVLEIAYGITVGPVLGWVDSSEFISGLAILGFLLLMFLSGFEIELDTFREKGLRTLALPMSIYLLTVITSFYLISTLGYPIFLALVLCTTSVDIVITILRSDGTIKTKYGQTLFMVALLADILTLLAATVYASFINAGGVSISNLNVVLYFVVVIMLFQHSLGFVSQYFFICFIKSFMSPSMPFSEERLSPFLEFHLVIRRFVYRFLH